MLHAIDRTTERFMRLLDESEEKREIGQLLALFTETAELRGPGQAEPLEGREGAKKFWLDSLAAFQTLHTSFLHVIEGRGGVALEWVAEGIETGGERVQFRGVTVLELENGLIRSLRVYQDAAARKPVEEPAGKP